MKNRGRSAAWLVAVAVAIVAAGPAWAADDTIGKISIESTSVAAGLGVAWGNGVLEYRGQQYPFTVTGLSIVDVGVSKLFARGEAHNLNSVEDFQGMFMAATAGASLGGGGAAGVMHNQSGVTMVWTGTNQGLSVSLAQSGMKVKFTSEALARIAANRKAPRETQPAASPSTLR